MPFKIVRACPFFVDACVRESHVRKMPELLLILRFLFDVTRVISVQVYVELT